MAAAGVTLTLEDAMPDALLWHPETDHLWVIEAVTSDGELDFHKVAQMERCGKSDVGFTTTYRTWREAAARQSAHGNVAVGTYIWIQADPAKHRAWSGRRFRRAPSGSPSLGSQPARCAS